MTISSETRKAGPFTGNGSTDSFPFTFKVFTEGDIRVVAADLDAVESALVLDADYSVTLNGDQDASPGGTITLLAGALTTGFKLAVVGDVANLQGTDLTNQGGFYPQTIEDMSDRSTIQIQQLAEELERSVKVPVTSDVSLEELTADLIRLGDSIDNIDTVATNISDVNSVANNMADVNLVAGNMTDVNSVADNMVAVLAVNANEANINAVNANEADISLVADNLADVTNFADVYQGPKATPPVLRNNGDALVAGDLYFDTTEGAVFVWSGSSWEAATLANSIVRDAQTATAAQTVITVPLYTVGSDNLALFINGVKMIRDLDYTETDQTTITMTTGLTLADNIEVIINRSVVLGASLSNIVFAATKSAADTLAASLPDGATVIVDRDETAGGVQTRRVVTSGVLGAPVILNLNVVESVGDLVAGNADGVAVNVRAYHAGLKSGGGTFYWDATGNKNLHNGGTVIDPTRTFPSDWTNGVQVSAWYTASTGVGVWRRQYEVGHVCPQMFGTFNDPAKFDSYQLNQFSLFVCSEKKGFDWFGDYYTNQPIVFDGIGGGISYRTGCLIYASSAVTEDILTFKGAYRRSRHVGHISANGFGDINFSARTARHGVVFSGDNSGFNADTISVSFVRGDGVVVEGIAAMASINSIRAWNCGSSPAGSIQKATFTVSGVGARDGANNGSPGQRQDLTVTGYDATKILPNSYIAVTSALGPDLYLVRATPDANTITISPWLPLSFTAGEATLCQGAGLRTIGADSSKVRVGTLDSLVCGFGLQDLTLYGATITNLVTQFCGAGAMISKLDGSCIGSLIVSGYFEANYLDYIKGTASSSFTAELGISVTLNPDKSRALGARYGFGETNYNFISAQNLVFNINNKRYSLINDPDAFRTVYNPSSFSLLIESWAARLFNFTLRTVVFVGSGVGGGPVSDFTLTVPAGYTINGGGTSLAVTTTGAPMTVYVRKDWGLGGESLNYVVKII